MGLLNHALTCNLSSQKTLTFLVLSFTFFFLISRPPRTRELEEILSVMQCDSYLFHLNGQVVRIGNLYTQKTQRNNGASFRNGGCWARGLRFLFGSDTCTHPSCVTCGTSVGRPFIFPHRISQDISEEGVNERLTFSCFKDLAIFRLPVVDTLGRHSFPQGIRN